MTIDLAAISAPEIIEPLSFEAILAARKARFIELAPDMAPVMDLESEPAVKLLEEASYDELLLRDRINLAAQAV
ncbi:MAG: baseplate assembly protein, partial [Azonexus sp.]|nr:baseplate assembly protein [Azonexus sp.]